MQFIHSDEPAALEHSRPRNPRRAMHSYTRPGADDDRISSFMATVVTVRFACGQLGRSTGARCRQLLEASRSRSHTTDANSGVPARASAVSPVVDDGGQRVPHRGTLLDDDGKGAVRTELGPCPWSFG